MSLEIPEYTFHLAEDLDVLDDDGDIVAENMTLGLGCIDQTHTFLLVSRSGRV